MALAALAMGCAGNGQPTQLAVAVQAEHAVPNDEANTSLLKIKGPDTTVLVLRSNDRGYRLRCTDPNKLLRLVNATGFDSSLLSFVDPISWAEAGLNPDEVQELRCDMPQTPAYKLHVIEYPDGKRYFLTFGQRNPEGLPILHMIGCEALILGMGYELALAVPIPYELKNDYFDTADAYDINCVKGKVPGAVDVFKISWDKIENTAQQVRYGQPIKPISLRAWLVDDPAYPVFYTLDNSQAPWLQLFNSTVQGIVPLPADTTATEFRAQVNAGAPSKNTQAEPLPIVIKATCNKPVYQEREEEACGVKQYRYSKDPICGYVVSHPYSITVSSRYYDSQLKSSSVSITVNGVVKKQWTSPSAIGEISPKAVCQEYGYLDAVPGPGSGWGGGCVQPCWTESGSTLNGQCVGDSLTCINPQFGVDAYFRCALPAFGLIGCAREDGMRVPELEYATDRPGQDLKSFDLDVADPRLCREACVEEPGCKAFSCVVAGVQGQKARCWLKKAIPGPTSDKNVISGLVRPADGFEWGADRPGSDYRRLSLEKAEPEACRDACQADPYCKAFTYFRPESELKQAVCVLRTNANPPAMNRNAVSGIVLR